MTDMNEGFVEAFRRPEGSGFCDVAGVVSREVFDEVTVGTWDELPEGYEATVAFLPAQGLLAEILVEDPATRVSATCRLAAETTGVRDAVRLLVGSIADYRRDNELHSCGRWTPSDAGHCAHCGGMTAAGMLGAPADHVGMTARLGGGAGRAARMMRGRGKFFHRGEYGDRRGDVEDLGAVFGPCLDDALLEVRVAAYKALNPR